MSNAINESMKSIKEDFYKNNQEFIDKGLENAFKSLKDNLFGLMNSAFTNFSNDHEKKLDFNRDIHERAVEALNNDIKKLRIKHSEKNNINKDYKARISTILHRMIKIKIFSKFFNTLLKNLKIKQYKQFKHNLILRTTLTKKRKNIFNSWRNITNALSKGRIKIKYSKIFTSKREELETGYVTEINKYIEILQKLEQDIASEIGERRSLAKLYDSSMTKGAEIFVKETNAVIDFNSSSKILYLFRCVYTQ
jgi:hypothetical protein